MSVSVMAGSMDRLGHDAEVKAGAEVEIEIGLEDSRDDVRGVATVQAAAPSSASDTVNTVDTACTACTANVPSLSLTGLLARSHETVLCWIDGVYRMSSPSTARTMEASSTDRSLKGLERFMCSLYNNQTIKQTNKKKEY
jgi:hypothetical protein